MELKRISLSKVLKLELPELVNGVIRIIEKHNPDALGLHSILDLLKEQQQQLKLLVISPTYNPLTPKAQLLSEKELQCVGAIVSHMQFIVRTDIESMRSATTIANPIVVRFLSGLRKNNASVINETIHQFLDHLDKHPKVYDALSSLGFQPFVDEIRKVNPLKLEVMDERDGRNQITTPKVDSKLIQQKAQNDLSFVFDYLDTFRSYDHNPNIDSLIKELNILLTRYATLINTRKTHNKNKSNNSNIIHLQKPFDTIDPEDDDPQD